MAAYDVTPSDADDLLEAARAAIGWRDAVIETGFGPRPLIYADYGASGRPCALVDARVETALALYANPHNEDSATGLAATRALHDACARIKRAVNAGPDHALILEGAGATSAIHRLQSILGLALPPATRAFLEETLDADLRERVRARLAAARPVVFVGPYEHHSNELTWRESLAETVAIGLDADGGIDLDALAATLADPQFEGRRKIGAFSAASNVTGVKTDVAALARLLHAHGAILCLDAAASAPYLPIDLSPADSDAAPDAVYFSPHKMVGGPGACGVLVVKKSLYRADLAPTVSGGGTVRYVTPIAHDFIADIEARERAGTPGLPQALRAAEAVELLCRIGWDRIAAREHAHVSAALDAWGREPGVEVLGPADPDRRIGLVSVQLRPGGPQADPLHPKLAARLLNDLYGIQARAGCSCAGPYGHHILGLTPEQTEAHRAAVLDGYAGLRPGWVRVSLHWSMSEAERDYLIQAMVQLARFGDRFAALYRFCPRTGAWTRPQADTRIKADTGGAWLMDETLRAVEAMAQHLVCEPAAIPLPERHAGLLRHAGLSVEAEPAGA
ncbi:MAG: aminotransferase class V-fold PLP-dependent enzyme [Oceanicaulis sp.]